MYSMFSLVCIWLQQPGSLAEISWIKTHAVLQMSQEKDGASPRMIWKIMCIHGTHKSQTINIQSWYVEDRVWLEFRAIWLLIRHRGVGKWLQIWGHHGIVFTKTWLALWPEQRNEWAHVHVFNEKAGQPFTVAGTCAPSAPKGSYAYETLMHWVSEHLVAEGCTCISIYFKMQ